MIPITAAGPGLTRHDLTLSTGPGIQGTPASPSRSPSAPAPAPWCAARCARWSPRRLDVSPTAGRHPARTGAVSVAANRLAGIDVAALLQSLDRYPYGCSEQTVSRALPLLYVNGLAASEKLGSTGRWTSGCAAPSSGCWRARIRAAPSACGRRRNAGDTWLDAYVTDFLTRARERGFAVPQTAFKQRAGPPAQHGANTTNVENGGMDLAYAAYVLARNGRPVMGDLRYLADTKIEDFAHPARTRSACCCARASLGDRGRAQKAFDAAVKALQAGRDKGDYRADYGSRLRDGAALLALSAETGFSQAVVQPWPP